MTFYDQLPKLLKDKGKSRKDLSLKTGIPYQTLSSLIHRKSENIRIDILIKIADYFEVSLDYLIKGEPFIVKERLVEYNQSNNEVEYQILRVSRMMGINDKYDFLQKGYEIVLSNKAKNND